MAKYGGLDPHGFYTTSSLANCSEHLNGSYSMHPSLIPTIGGYHGSYINTVNQETIFMIIF
jgi:hypothetical protein